jgi:hypothetical protein
MKKIILVALLLATTGGALYYFLSTKKGNSNHQTSFQKTLLGEWKIDSVALSKKDSGNAIALFALSLDSNFLKYTYDFKDDGAIIKKLGDSIYTEKIGYQLKDSVTIVYKEGESADESFELKLSSKEKNGFVLMDKDSTRYFFKRQIK